MANTNKASRIDAIQSWDARKLCIDILEAFNLHYKAGYPLGGPFIFLPPVRKQFQEEHRYEPNKWNILHSFRQRDVQLDTLNRHQEEEDYRRWRMWQPKKCRMTYDPHNQDHRETFRIAYLTWHCTCWPGNGWTQEVWNRKEGAWKTCKYYDQHGARALMHENSTRYYWAWVQNQKAIEK